MSYIQPTLIGGFVAATLDIIYAISLAYMGRRVMPQQLLQYIASGILGESAYSKGGTAAALGLLFHYLITFVMALVFVFAVRNIPELNTYPVLAGALYGCILYVVMMYVVIPFSRTFPKKRPKGALVIIELCSHMFFVGVPIAYSVVYF